MYRPAVHYFIYGGFEMKYNEIKNSLKVYTAEKTLENYKDCIYQTMENGLSLVPYYETMPGMPLTISKEMFEEWKAENENLSVQTLIDDALRAGKENDPPFINNMESVIAELLGTAPFPVSPHQKADEPGLSFSDNEFMYVITNESREGGASSLFYPGVMSNIAAALGEAYYVLPSSVHELILVRESNAPTLHEFETMVREINAAEVKPEDQLSDGVFYYDKTLDKLIRAEDRGKEYQEMEQSSEEELSFELEEEEELEL